MRLIQDILKTQVVEVKTELGLTNMKFKFSTGAEFVNELIKLTENKTKYPFFFVDSKTVVYSRETVSIGKIIIATLTKSEYTSEQRETKTFGDILVPIVSKFIEDIWIHNPDMSVMKHGTVVLNYFFGNSGIYGVDGNVFADAVDAIELNNFQFRISKTLKN